MPCALMTKSVTALRTILFDLDGTLADTASDIAYALNTLLEQEGRPALPLETLRSLVSQGTKPMLCLGFDIEAHDPSFEPLRQRLLNIYRAHLTRETRLFPGMQELLTTLERRGLNWGVVTNKPAWLAEPLIAELGLAERTACVVGGDTVAQSKPHPAPMLHACNLAGSEAQQCLYVGDAANDIKAGKRAGMKTLVALFGYIPKHEQPHNWGADGMIAQPLDLLDWLDTHA